MFQILLMILYAYTPKSLFSSSSFALFSYDNFHLTCQEPELHRLIDLARSNETKQYNIICDFSRLYLDCMILLTFSRLSKYPDLFLDKSDLFIDLFLRCGGLRLLTEVSFQRRNHSPSINVSFSLIHPQLYVS